MAKLKTGRHTGALKAARKAERRERVNRAALRSIRSVAKEFKQAVSKKNADQVRTLLPRLSSAWDKAAGKGVIHWKAAARKKSRLAQHAARLLA